MKKLFLFSTLVVLTFFTFSFKRETPVTEVSKSLVFPVAGAKSNVGSFWGDVRDGGERSHRGIDIFAKKGTPVVAISDGYISQKGTFPRGGKVLWMRSTTHPLTAYYAHLDSWAVNEGDYVKKGQVIGTVGRTGNAITTPPHLHFGLYTNKGAVDPLPYVKKAPKIAAPKVSPAKKTTTTKKTTAVKRTTTPKKTTTVKKATSAKKTAATKKVSAKKPAVASKTKRS